MASKKRFPGKRTYAELKGRRRNRRGFEWLEPRLMLDGATAVITEFLAVNEGGLADEDGDHSDWIEIYNPSDVAIDLDGWYLSDDDAHLAKWQFPAVSLDSGQYLLVYASDKDRAEPTGQLHTNFRLDAGGDYLALVQPDGITVASEFDADGEDFPKQFDDVSYGVLQGAESTALIGEAAQADVLIPPGDALGDAWTEVGFIGDASWTRGRSGIGFDVGGSAGGGGGDPVEGGTAVLQLDFNDKQGESGTADTEAGFTMFDLDDNGGSFQGVTVTLSAFGGASLDDRDRSTPTDQFPDFTLDQLYDDFIFAYGTSDGVGMEVHLQGLLPATEYQVKLWSFDSGSRGARVSDWVETSGPQPASIESSYTFDGADLPTSNDDNTMTAMLTTSASGELRLRGTRNGGTSHGVFLNALQLVLPGTSGLIRTDVESEMHGQNASAYVRFPFTVDADAGYDQLSLRMMYDAGFVAYLNGHEVARQNAPGVPDTPLAFDASATLERTLEETTSFEQFNLTPYAGLLNVGGPNVLAIQGLNSTATDDDFLLLPKLTATSLEGSGLRYFVAPTPSEPNGTGLLGFVKDTTFSVDWGFFDAPIELAITSNTPGATIVYTTDGSQPSPTHGVMVPAAGPDAPPTAVLPIETTSYVRAMALKDGFLPTNVDTHSYIFLDDVLQQDPTPGVDYPSTWQSSKYQGDYHVDPEVVAQWDDYNPANRDYGIREALKSIPTMSIVMDHEDLWGSSKGIYNHAQSRGEAWRRPGSIEYFDPATGREYQANTGVQMHGGASRDNGRQLKHSFRLLFRGDFGPEEFRFPLFEDSSAEASNTLVLRACFTDGFATRTVNGRYSPLDSQYTRDVWMRDMQLAMGHPSAHSTFVHLYINGLYWGLYNPTERPDDAFQAEYLGGDRENYDIIKDFNELFHGSKTAWNAMFSLANAGLASTAAYQRIQGNNPDGSPNPALPNYLDVDNLIDYMILHLFGGAEDWPHHNWYAARDRVGETTGFRFYVWDQEIVLDGFYRDRTDVSNDYTPARLYSRLRQNAEFRLRFADRLHKHFFNDGVLTPEKAGQIWMARADEIEAAIIGESARWGDAREGNVGQSGVIVPTMTVDLWRAERDNVRDNYLPRSRQLTLSRFIADNLYPSLTAPSFNQHGGYASPGFELVIEAPEGAIYYTLDGTDPRRADGGLSPTVRQYPDDPITLSDTTVVKARVRLGQTWSALNEAEFFVTVPATAETLVVTELNYNPHDPSSEELAGGKAYVSEDFEFIELRNVSAASIDLAGVRFARGIDFQLAADAVIEVGAGEFVVIAKNIEAFEARYGSGINVAGSYAHTLTSFRNSGETVELTDRFGGTIASFSYNDSGPWPGRADGNGSSLEILDPSGDYDNPSNWRSSSEFGGSPGVSGFGPRRDVWINEVLSNADLEKADAIELHNATTEDIDIGGWYLSDSNNDFRKFRIPDETILAAGQYRVFGESQFNPEPTGTGFALNGAHGDDVWLLEADETGRLRSFVDHVEFDAAANGESFGRWPDAQGPLYPMRQDSFGAANVGPRVGPVVISELMYNPMVPSPEADPDDFEYTEIHNPTLGAVDLTDWRIRKGIDFDFPAGSLLSAGESLLVVPFAVTDVARLAALRDHYGLDPSVRIMGPYSGKLNDDGEKVQLQRPDSPPPGEPDYIPHLIEDEVVYGDVDLWPTEPDGTGTSLARLSLSAWGNDAASWMSEAPTPGTVTIADDAYEPNNSLATAFLPAADWSDTPLSAIAGPGIQADADWYRIDVPENQRYLTVDVTFSHALGNIDVRLVDSFGSVYEASQTVTDNERIDAVLPHAGRWHLNVFGENTAGAYDLVYSTGYVHPGDADLSGATDLSDFNIWNANKFMTGTDWTAGDFNGDGNTDLSDFNIWNAFKFTTAPSPAPVDTVLEEVGDSKSDALASQLAWLSEVDRSTANKRSVSSSSTAEAVVDKLLAAYWP